MILTKGGVSGEALSYQGLKRTDSHRSRRRESSRVDYSRVSMCVTGLGKQRKNGDLEIVYAKM